MPMDIADFTIQVERLKKRPAQEVIRIQKSVAFDFLRRVGPKIPWKTGTLRRGTQVAINTIPTAPVQNQSPVSAANTALANLQPFSVVWIVNNVFYARYIEFGTEKMAPRAPFARAREEVLQALSAGAYR